MTGEYDALLEVLDFSKGEGAPRWRWRISSGDTSGEAHECSVDLTGDSPGRQEYYGFLTDPSGFIRNTWLDEAGKANTLRRLSHWLRSSVLTQGIWDRLPLGRPSTVLIRLNPQGPEREMLGYPLVLAADDSGSLVKRRLTFVHDVSSGPSLVRRAAKDRPLHLVGVFNRTKTGEPLDLHAEQSQVFSTVRDIAADGDGMDVTSRTLSYHVTHDQLKDLVESAKRGGRQHEGRWQMILHLADRGVPGSWSAVSRSGESGTKQPLSASELVDMLQTSDNDERLRLAVITTRPVSSPSIADQLDLFRIPSHLAAEPSLAASPQGDADLAVDLARRLGCAVLAFRHRIGDQAAVDFVTKVYAYLLERNLTLPRAVGTVLAECDSLKTLDRVAPVIYGAEACGLVVAPPRLHTPDPPTLEDPPPSLIGHHDPMWKASEIFARIGSSTANGAVLHGMAGVGKTTCADELLSQYAHRYREVVRYPLKGGQMDDDPSDALCGFVGELLKLPALRAAFDSRSEAVPAPADLAGFLADDIKFERLCTDIEQRLTKNNREYALVFLSDVEKLIKRQPWDLRAPSANGHEPSARGPWIHPRWERLINAMAVPKAPGFRLLITSPRALRLDQRQMPDVRVPLLAPAEAYLYAQSLPDLGRVITDAAAGNMSGEDERDLVRRVIVRAEGHPGLLRFADEVAAGGGGYERLRRLATADADQLEQEFDERIPEVWQRIQRWTLETLRCIPRDDPRHLLLLALSWLSHRHRELHPDGDDCSPGLLGEVWAGLRSRAHCFTRPVGEHGGTEGQSADGERDELRFLLESLEESCLIDCLAPTDGKHLKIRMQLAVVTAVQRDHASWLDPDGELRAEVERIARRHTEGRVKVALRHRTHGRTAAVQQLIPDAMPYLERAGDWETWLHFVAVSMSRSRRGRSGLDDTVRKLERVTAAIKDRESDQFTMAQRLSDVFEALGKGERPGLSALLGEGPGDTVVDNSPLAMAMSVGILSGLRDTGRLTEAREVAQDYLRFVASGSGAGLVASAVEVELLRVLVDEGKLSEALDRVEYAFEELADVRFRDAVRTRWADGEILRRKLFTIRRDIHVLRAKNTSEEDPSRVGHMELACADHERLGQQLLLEGHDEVERHLHIVEGCLLELDRRVDIDGDELEAFDQKLMGCLQEVERSGDIVVRAMTDAARAQIRRRQAERMRRMEGEDAWHRGMKAARDYELKALRLLYAQGTPMDIGVCHRRIGDDQLACQHEPLRRTTPAHHMYAGLIGRLTGAHALRPQAAHRAGGTLPGTVEELCERVGEDLFGEGSKPVPGALDPKRVLGKIANDAEVERAFRELSADS